MRVVLSGYYGFHNVGDEAILISIITALKKFKSDIEITVLSNDPDYTRETYEVDAVNRWDLKQVANVIKNSDGLISGGGSLLQDATSNKTVPYYTGVMFIAKMLKKPYFVYAQGMGPVNGKINQWLTKLASNHAKLLTVRDEDSKLFLEKIGVKNKIDLVPDPVLGLNIPNCEYQWFENLGLTNQIITVSVRDWETGINFKEKIAKALNKLVEDGNEVILLPMHGKHDEETCKAIEKMMREKVIIAPYDATIEEKITIISKSVLLIGMRLHALIFAAVSDVPFIALSYDPKIDAFSNLCNQVVVGHVCHEDWDDQTLFALSQKVMGSREDYVLSMKEYTNNSKLSAQLTADKVITALS